jgi:hypothetical protein
MEHSTKATANTVTLDIPPSSRLGSTLCSKFNLDMTSRLSFGANELYAIISGRRFNQNGRL